MAAALLIFCRSWAASVSVFSMRSPPAHIWTCCMQLGVREKKNVCKSTSPEKPRLGPCSKLIKPIPSLVYPFLFSLHESDHLPP
jgi:hypothetical protein